MSQSDKFNTSTVDTPFSASKITIEDEYNYYCYHPALVSPKNFITSA